jgi:hypothetical protein
MDEYRLKFSVSLWFGASISLRVTLKIEVMRSFKTWVSVNLRVQLVPEGEGNKIFESSANTYPVTQRSIQEDPKV